MEELLLQSKVFVMSYNEFSVEDRALIDAARVAAMRGYAVYSHFRVGAALRLSDGTFVTGNNQENAAYPSGLCAERIALFWANSQYPDKTVHTIAIAAQNELGELKKPISPCGACRQVILETEKRFSTSMRIILFGTDKCYLIEGGIKELLPLSFDSEFLN